MSTKKKLLVVLLAVLMIGAVMAVIEDNQKSDDDKSIAASTSSMRAKSSEEYGNGLSKEQQEALDKLEDAMNDRDAEAAAERVFPLEVFFDVDTIIDVSAKEYESETGMEVTEEEKQKRKKALKDLIEIVKAEMLLQEENVFETFIEEYGDDFEWSLEVTSVEKTTKDDIDAFKEGLLSGFGENRSYIEPSFNVTDAVKISGVTHLKGSKKSEDVDFDDSLLYKCNGNWYIGG